jgi:GNAT superfamily N-acetyltransferase
MREGNVDIEYRISPMIDDTELNRLFAAAWPGHRGRAYGPVLARSFTYICAFTPGGLVGFVNVAWDGGVHAFLLDTTVAPEYRRRGVGTELVRRAADVARRAGLEWLHVDYEPHLDGFYRGCGFRPTTAGLLRLPAKPA